MTTWLCRLSLASASRPGTLARIAQVFDNPSCIQLFAGPVNVFLPIVPSVNAAG